MSFLLPQSTIELERSRLSTGTTTFEFLQCFSGTFEVRNSCGNSILCLNDAPLLRLSRDLKEGIRSLQSNKRTVTVVDFYGEFELEITRVGPDEICIKKNGTAECVTAGFVELVDSLQSALCSFILDFDTLFPLASHNSDYKELRDQIKSAIEVAS